MLGLKILLKNIRDKIKGIFVLLLCAIDIGIIVALNLPAIYARNAYSFKDKRSNLFKLSRETRSVQKLFGFIVVDLNKKG